MFNNSKVNHYKKLYKDYLRLHEQCFAFLNQLQDKYLKLADDHVELLKERRLLKEEIHRLKSLAKNKNK